MDKRHIKISRSGLRLFLECQRCFWLEIHHKIRRPPTYPYTLSGAVDYLVKKEFDIYREKEELPPILIEAGIKAKLFNGTELADWRSNFAGLRYKDDKLDATLYGAVDDVLEFPDGSFSIVDYKSTGAKEVTIYEDYQKQMDVYSFLLGENGYKTNNEAYFIFYMVRKDQPFNHQLTFKSEIKKIEVDTSWVYGTFEEAVELARSDLMPPPGDTCNHCQFVEDIHALKS